MLETQWETALTTIRIVLVEPAGALNVGSIARVMKNMGLTQMVLVSPHCDPMSCEAKTMAVHAQDVLESAQIVDSLPQALIGCQKAIATTARDRSFDRTLEHPRTTLPWLLQSPAALIFGPEDRGLSNTELNYAQRIVRIPSSSAYESLNLAQAVAVCCYELSLSAQTLIDSSTLPTPEPSEPLSATLDQLEGYYQQLETLLLKIGYVYPHTVSSRMEKFRHLFNRAQPSSTEVAMLRGVISQVEWALTVKQHPPS
ncbi:MULTISPECIES: RNA methyltransferase [Arthrospira]|uniref:tRNA (cytidine/uridine-2'-O-)-methyltransferase TrmJ n=1 Tax=Limnospira platensis NIES-46 TaxID=1236695 RepID=A0A5M3TBE2_LIMPL|nr:RNA methyltransferase [Arthrospira platensis]KDR55447.1 RNA methyltransferase [Arthrospira platensis str. Paraca]MBD2668565.1 RNA methyltransferase [Arthrospira platensis FACHB-439]MBD2709246.1 RNA methyltransferase [Arthrospira platensis FACHB-835]MDF2211346.1 RNA methyltransferase [Arthrospira platensis NCB002]MDT9181704.1 RNA methyltransferase [Limnospira sp. PMC 289.06]MDT9294962.1 RNA methyltransferase [Arthrospira platensis PCC 7345]MDT9309300.1 RNA methyltransferase [Limnospira sp.